MTDLGPTAAVNEKDASNIGSDPPFNLQEENIGGLFSNLTLLSMILYSLAGNKTLLKPILKLNRSYDYIIVGGGSAGAVLANRLTEKSCIDVLLLEAGGEPPLLTDVPAYARIFYGTPIDWYYKTTPQLHAAFGQKENRVILNNGKALGGSSIINAMHAVRGNKRNYDMWEEVEGATGWSYKDVLPYFLKLEDNHNIAELDPTYHNTGGPVTFERINYTPEIKQPLIEALKSLGYTETDSNGERQTGAFDLQATVRNQQRCSSKKAYLDPITGKRQKLHILTRAYARKVLINKESKQAYGVEFDYGGNTRTVYASKEVILSTGGIKTPQLLMLSGIGPRDQLERLNIELVADLPVGKNLMDHFAGHQVYTLSETVPNIVEKVANPVNILDYVLHRKGPLCSPSETALLGFTNGMNNTKNIDFPDQQLFFIEYETLDTILNMNLKEEVFERVYKPYVGKPVYICIAQVLQPFGRGEITLNSTDPYATPLIDPKYYVDERDLKTVVAGMKVCNAVARHPALQELKAEPLKTIMPGCEEFVGDEDKYLTCYAQHVVNTIWHYSGTAKMGRVGDSKSVVDSQLKVIGVNGLRVVNAAAFPIIPSGNTNVPTMMLAEKASDIIKEGIKCDDNED